MSLREVLPTFGVKATKVALGDITLRDDVVQKRIEAWQSSWARRNKELELDGTRETKLYIESAKAQAQADMVITTIRTLQSMAGKGVATPPQVVERVNAWILENRVLLERLSNQFQAELDSVQDKIKDLSADNVPPDLGRKKKRLSDELAAIKTWLDKLDEIKELRGKSSSQRPRSDTTQSAKPESER
jgi:predicted nuclease with TOPRIM domain